MSGYRSIHRENIGSFPIWQLVCSPVLSKNRVNAAACWRVWCCCGDGAVRGFLVIEKTLEQKDTLDAAACNFILTHTLLGSSQQNNSSSNPSEQQQQENQEVSTIGCSQIQVVRNYVGDDDAAGDLIVVTLDLSGKIRIWVLSEEMDDDLLLEIDDVSSCRSSVSFPVIDQEFIIEGATGTCLKILPPNVYGVGDILLAVPCLDGTIALVATGLSTLKSTKYKTEAGVIVERWSKNATNSIALCGSFHPKKKSFAVGRQDGLVEIFEKGNERCHRLIHHETPVRALSFTPDGNLLLTSSDDGMLCMWDTSRPKRVVPVLVHHVVQSHTTWILDIKPLLDSRRFVSCGMDQQLQVWSAGEMDNRALHSFTSDDSVWTIDTISSSTQTRLVSGSENGGLHIYTLES